jgi:chorismate lyase/3-hydroxybenzoate synthase
MSAAPEHHAATTLMRLDPPRAPAWVAEALGEDAKEGTRVESAGTQLRITESPEYLFVDLTVPGVESLDDEAYCDAVRRVYRTLNEIVGARGVHVLRLWNYIPGIVDPASGGSTRYEVFNIGRFRGCSGRFSERELSHRFCAASAVGHRGSDLVIHALAGRAPSEPIENPRQRPAYRYSRRYGPQPPSFARAVRLEHSLRAPDSARSALVSGTASIVGENTRHPGDTECQLAETLQNLLQLSRALAGDVGPTTDLSLECAAAQDALARYTDLRVYVVHDDDAGGVLATLERTLPGLRRLELAAADLCRSGLRVEVEGIARLDP